jgi:hypothetical protein
MGDADVRIETEPRKRSSSLAQAGEEPASKFVLFGYCKILFISTYVTGYFRFSA